MKSTISPLDSDIKIPVNGSIAADSCVKVHEITYMLNRLTLNLQLNIIAPKIELSRIAVLSA